MKSFLLLAIVVSLQAEEAPQNPPAPQSSPASQELSREILEHWEPEMSKTTSWSRHQYYLWAWVDVDPDKALELARKEPFRKNAAYYVLEPLIARRAWKHVAKLTETLDPVTLNDRLWARAAAVAGNHCDEAGLDFIEQQVERFEKLAGEKANENKLTFTAARFCLAAARLELVRKKAEEPEPGVKADGDPANSGYVVTTGFGTRYSAPEKQIRALRIAVARQANEPSTQAVWPGWNTLDYDDFLALESWLPDHRGGGYDRGRKKDLSLPLLKLAPDFSWVPPRLPAVNSSTVRPWIGRQLLRGRYRLPVAYLARCGAPDSVRAGLLAEIAGELPKEENELAMSYLRTATRLSSSADNDSDQDLMLSAANLSAACHRLGMKTASRSWARKALRILRSTDLELTMHVRERDVLSLPVLPSHTPEATAEQQQRELDYYNNWAERLMTAQPKKPTIGYGLLKAVAVSAVLNDIPRDSLPVPLIEWIDAQSTSGTQKSWKLPTAGLKEPRHIELVSLTDPAKMRTSQVSEDYAKFNRLKSTKQWAAAADHLQQLVKSNPTWWNRYLLDLAATSVKEAGLEQTLEWTSKIQDTSTRMRVEIHAVRAATQRPEPPRLPQLEGKPTSILPGLRMSGLWGC